MKPSIWQDIYNLFGDPGFGVIILLIYCLNFYLNYDNMQKNRAKYKRWDKIRLQKKKYR